MRLFQGTKMTECPGYLVSVSFYIPFFSCMSAEYFGISRATDGFSAMQTIIFSLLVFTLTVYKVTRLFLIDRMKKENREHTVATSHIRLHKWLILNFPAFPSFVGTDIHYIRTDMIIGKFPFRVFGIAFHLLHIFRQRFG